jgi:hypothetical protein
MTVTSMQKSALFQRNSFEQKCNVSRMATRIKGCWRIKVETYWRTAISLELAAALDGTQIMQNKN